MHLQNYFIFIAIFGALTLLLNVYAIAFIKSDERYWLVCIPLWVILVAGFPAWVGWCHHELDLKDKVYWASAEGKIRDNDAKWETLQSAKEQLPKAIWDFWWILGFQTLLTFILQIIGYKLFRAGPYSWSVILFGAIVVIFLVMSLILSAIPSGPLI